MKKMIIENALLLLQSLEEILLQEEHGAKTKQHWNDLHKAVCSVQGTIKCLKRLLKYED